MPNLVKTLIPVEEVSHYNTPALCIRMKGPRHKVLQHSGESWGTVWSNVDQSQRTAERGHWWKKREPGQKSLLLNSKLLHKWTQSRMCRHLVDMFTSLQGSHTGEPMAEACVEDDLHLYLVYQWSTGIRGIHFAGGGRMKGLQATRPTSKKVSLAPTVVWSKRPSLQWTFSTLWDEQ